MDADGFGGVARTRRVKTATGAGASQRRKHRRQGVAVKPQQRQGETGDERRRHEKSFWQASWKRRSNSAKGVALQERRATRSRSKSGETSAWCLRKSSRRRRFARARNTALPTEAVEATTPTRAVAQPGTSALSRRLYQSVKPPHSRRRPFSRANWKSRCRRTCCSGRKRMAGEARRLRRRSSACGQRGGDWRGPCGHPWWTCGRGSRSYGRAFCGVGGMWVAWSSI
jgi:hypothetical protein